MLRATDTVRALLEATADGTPEPSIDELLEGCHAALGGPAPSAAAAPAAPIAAAAHYRIALVPGRDVFRRGLDPMLALRDLAMMGEVTAVVCDTSRLPGFAALDPDSCYLSWTLDLATTQPAAAIEEVLSFLAEGGEVAVTAIEEEPPRRLTSVRMPVLPPMMAAAIAAAPAAAAFGPPTVVPAPAAAVRPGTPTTVMAPRAPASPTSAALRGAAATIAPRNRSMTTTGAAGRSGAAADAGSSIRVAVDKVDRLMNLVGELVINQSMVAQLVHGFTAEKLARLQEAVSEMERNTRELQERVMAIRMVPVASVFSRVPRLVHDLAGRLNKVVEVELVGEDTELDKGVVEHLADPLIHLVRNSLDHGLETPDQRRAAGKPAHGTLRLEAYHRGGNVVIEVSDDGRGLDLARVKAKAIERGLIAATDELDDQEIVDLVFAPGFSTASEVSDVSGRGVGMDVVKRNVASLNGSVALESRPGAGTTCRIALPLTLAILDGLCLKAGDHVYVLPLTTIVESLRPRPAQLRSVFGRGEVVMVRDEVIPLVRLHELFGLTGCVTDATAGLVILVEDHGRKIGLLVDDITGQAQVVIKSLETHYHRVEGLMGATILGDGQVALILDVQLLVRAAHASAGTPFRHQEGQS